MPIALRRRLSAAGKEADGVYYAQLSVGTPPRNFSAILDTGSRVAALPCAACAHCGARHARFDPANSSTAALGAPYSQCYAEGSCNRGTLVSDIVCLDGACGRADFGCCTVYSLAFQRQEADGIAGRELFGEAFALALTPEGGEVRLGPPPPEGVVWAAMDPDGSVSASALAVGNVSVALGGLAALVDTGTSFVYLPASAFARVREAFAALEAAVPGESMYCTRAALERFPVLRYVLDGGASISQAPGEYFYEAAPGVRCVGIFADRRMVLGASALVNQHVYFAPGRFGVGEPAPATGAPTFGPTGSPTHTPEAGYWAWMHAGLVALLVLCAAVGGLAWVGESALEEAEDEELTVLL